MQMYERLCSRDEERKLNVYKTEEIKWEANNVLEEDDKEDKTEEKGKVEETDL